MSKRSSTKNKTGGDSTKKKTKIEETHNVEGLQDMAHKLRIHSIEMTNASNSGHPTSCSSIAELISVMFFDQSGMHYDCQNPKQSFTSDRFVLSKGHAAPILFAAWAENGFIDKAQLLNLRKIDCELEGHPTPILPFVDVATGSLGQGLGAACGMAYSSKYLDKLNNRFWVVMGDGESAEGSVWEAANFASFYKLDNITAIVDVNRLGQSQETLLGHQVKTYHKRFESFGWNVITIDGHNIEQIINAFTKSRNHIGQPTMIIATTFKGKYFPTIEDQLDWHGKPLTGDKFKEIIAHLKTLIKDENVKLEPTKPEVDTWPELEEYNFELGQLSYNIGDKIATRNAYGTALKRLGEKDPSKRIVALDADTKNSTFSITFKNQFPDNFVECFIAEQNMASIATGLQCRRKVPFSSTFGCFLSRAYDQIRMGGISRANMVFCGSHVGVSIGEDGPSQMALEDLAMFRALPNSIVFYPSDAVSAERAVELAANTQGIRYIRTSRPANPVLYKNDEVFKVGQSKTVRQSQSDQLLVVSGGVILHEALKAAENLAKENIHIRVLDLFTVKPVDEQGLIEAAQNSNNIILTAEEHYLNGGIHDAVCGALGKQQGIQIYGVGVDHVPRSGKPEELLDLYGLSAAKLQATIKNILKL